MHNKKSEQGSVDIAKATVPQLKEILDRQNKLLSNSKFINNLPDKGQKIKSYKEKIEKVLESRNSLQDTCDLMSRMVLNKLPNEIEWDGKNAVNGRHDKEPDKDDDDDCGDPLKLVATHSGTIKSYSKRVEEATPSLVTEKDIKEVETFNLGSPSYASKLCNKFDSNTITDRFKPNEPKEKDLAKDGYKRSTEHVRERLGKNWEITAATPPVPVHGSTGKLSLSDSLFLQQQQARRLKEIQLEDAMLKLREAPSFPTHSGSCLPTRNLMKYRDPSQLFEGTPVSSHHEDPTDDTEVPESDGAVFYNIVDDEPEH